MKAKAKYGQALRLASTTQLTREQVGKITVTDQST